jgi:hypothetical protein
MRQRGSHGASLYGGQLDTVCAGRPEISPFNSRSLLSLELMAAGKKCQDPKIPNTLKS